MSQSKQNKAWMVAQAAWLAGFTTTETATMIQRQLGMLVVAPWMVDTAGAAFSAMSRQVFRQRDVWFDHRGFSHYARRGPGRADIHYSAGIFTGSVHMPPDSPRELELFAAKKRAR